MSKSTIIPQETAASAIERALRIRVGRGKLYSYQGLSEATGIAVRTLESYVQGSTPGLGALLSLCQVLGPSFTSDVLSPAGMTAQPASESEAEHMRVVGLMGALTAEIAEAQADGHIDHQERARMRPFAQQLSEALHPLTQDEAAIPLRGVVT